MADPYTSKAAADASPKQKIDEVHKIMKEAKFGMLTTQAPNGQLHSRAMTPASSKGLIFSFVANTDSGKFDDLETNPEVNISFSDPSSTDWVSVAGKGSIIKDASTLKELWNPLLKAWFGDKGDGKHTGDWQDPRVAAIQVEPTEIRYWLKTSTSIGMTYEVVKGAVTGETASPGVLRILNESDLKLAKQLDDA